jgi:hypothetical protein
MRNTTASTPTLACGGHYGGDLLPVRDLDGEGRQGTHRRATVVDQNQRNGAGHGHRR